MSVMVGGGGRPLFLSSFSFSFSLSRPLPLPLPSPSGRSSLRELPAFLGPWMAAHCPAGLAIVSL
jgi:hypothetical protein